MKETIKDLFKKIYRFIVSQKDTEESEKIKVQSEINICNKDIISGEKAYNLCTMSGEKYILKLLALYKSLCKTNNNFHLWVLCMNDFSFHILYLCGLKNITLIRLNDIEDDRLKSIKDMRNVSEYCWTLKAPLIEYVQNKTEGKDVVYVDSDLYFFKDPSIIFKKLEQYSIYLCPQRDLDYIEDQYGKYQAGLIGFKSDDAGKAGLLWWKEKCLDWCYHRYDPEGKRYGDQKYLDELPILFKSVFIEPNLGINAAPWNSIYSKKYSIEVDGSNLKIDNDDIIAFHFACINIYNFDEFDLWNLGTLDISPTIIRNLYVPYLKTILQVAKMVLKAVPICEKEIFHSGIPAEAKTYYKYNADNINKKDFYCYNFCSIVSHSYVVQALALYKSIEKNQDNFHIWLCAVDDEAYSALNAMKLENATVILSRDVDKSGIRSNRNEKEYCWSLKSIFIEYVLDNYNIGSILYCDADMFFFSDVKYIYQEWGTYSFFVCTQRADEKTEQDCGYYQAGLLGFKNDSYGRKILSWLKEECINWCYDIYDYNLKRWGDQKYLEKIPMLFENIKICTNSGINAAPWNLILNNESYVVTSYNEDILISNYKLCAYHFGSMLIYNIGNFDLWYHSPIRIKKEILNIIYKPYAKCLNKVIEEMVKVGLELDTFFTPELSDLAKNHYLMEEV